MEYEGICLLCKNACHRYCEMCTRAICWPCKSKIDTEIKNEEQKLKDNCQWCIGTTDISKFCDKCTQGLDAILRKHIKLGPTILLKKYGTADITREMVHTTTKIYCRCFSGVKCTCSTDSKDKIHIKYGIVGYKIIDYYTGDINLQYGTSSICTLCKN